MGWRAAFLVFVVACLTGGARADVDPPFTIEVPEVYCNYDGTIEGYEQDAELKTLILGHQTMIAAYEPCEGSGLPMGTAFAIGILSADDDPTPELTISRAQYLARLDRRTGPAVWEHLRESVGELDDATNDGTIPLGVVARDADGIHFGFVHTGGSRDERDWQVTLLGNTLIDDLPVLVTTVARYGNLESYNATLGRHVAVIDGLVAANAPLMDLETVDTGFWIQVVAVAVVLLLAALVSWNLLRRREADAFDPDDELVEPGEEADEDTNRSY